MMHPLRSALNLEPTGFLTGMIFPDIATAEGISRPRTTKIVAPPGNQDSRLY